MNTIGNLYIKQSNNEFDGTICFTGSFSSNLSLDVKAKQTVKISYGENEKIYTSYGEKKQITIPFSTSPATEFMITGKIQEIYICTSPINSCKIYSMQDLTLLELPYNGIAEVAFYETDNIKKLDLELNNLTNLEVINGLSNLEYLKLNFMTVEGINYENFPKLKELSLMSCSLTAEDLEKLPEGIEVLNVYMNNITNIAENTFPSTLKKLKIDVSDAELDMSKLPGNLTALDISGSQNLLKFENLAQLKELRRFCVAGCAVDTAQMTSEWYNLFTSLPQRTPEDKGILYISEKSAAELASLEINIPSNLNWTINTDGYIPDEF